LRTIDEDAILLEPLGLQSQFLATSPFAIALTDATTLGSIFLKILLISLGMDSKSASSA
jgi:hypothetical protein